MFVGFFEVWRAILGFLLHIISWWCCCCYSDAKGQFSYWSVRAGNRPSNKGIRLDYFICSPDMFSVAEGGEVETETEDARTRVLVHDSYILHKETVGCSDHCPVVLVVKME